MISARLSEIVKFCDKLLKVNSFKDYNEAINGLQFQNNGKVTKIGAAVDVDLQTIQNAIDNQCDMIVVHHGLMWNATHPFVGKRYEMIKLLVNHNVAVYSSHLPLDANPDIGNNIMICKKLGLKKTEPFLNLKGQSIGFKARCSIKREKLKSTLAQIIGQNPILIPHGPDVCKRIGIVSGGAGEDLNIAVQEGVDTYITGEGPYWTQYFAEISNINVFYCGHYQTETFGVKALAETISKKFKLPWIFINKKVFI